ncbi:MAG: hypothetical protein SRB2_04672 [Desulfobacteraceae bacterium Eth-SRB2]|nr:MAG: hypothetical protein SRB2_04672 [Desulfobacteraceae bacterium Eth-SRB2]
MKNLKSFRKYAAHVPGQKIPRIQKTQIRQVQFYRGETNRDIWFHQQGDQKILRLQNCTLQRVCFCVEEIKNAIIKMQLCLPAGLRRHDVKTTHLYIQWRYFKILIKTNRHPLILCSNYRS